MLLSHLSHSLFLCRISAILFLAILVYVKTQWSEIRTTKLQLPPHVYRIFCQQNDTLSASIHINPFSYFAISIYKFEYRPESIFYLLNNSNTDIYNFSLEVADSGSYYIQLKDFDHTTPIVEYSMEIWTNSSTPQRFSEKVFTLLPDFYLVYIGSFPSDTIRYKAEPVDSLTTKLSVIEQTSHIQTIQENQIHYIQKRLKGDQFFFLLRPKESATQTHQIYFHLQCKQCINKTNSEEPNNAGLVIGICLGSLFIVLACVLTVLFFRRKKNQSQINYAEKPEAQRQEINIINVKSSLDELHRSEQYATVPNILCAICLQPKPNMILSCQHQLHEKCIQQWKISHKECPACKFTINNIIPIQLQGNNRLNGLKA